MFSWTAADRLALADAVLFSRVGIGTYLYRRLVRSGRLPADAPMTWATITRCYTREATE